MSTRSPLARRGIAAALLVLLTACYSWEPTPISPQQLIPAEMPSSVRTTLRNGASFTLDNPTVRNDTIFGVTDLGVASVATEDIGLFEVSRFDTGETLWAISGAVSLVGLIVGLATMEPCCSFFGP